MDTQCYKIQQKVTLKGYNVLSHSWLRLWSNIYGSFLSIYIINSNICCWPLCDNKATGKSNPNVTFGTLRIVFLLYFNIVSAVLIGSRHLKYSQKMSGQQCDKIQCCCLVKLYSVLFMWCVILIMTF